MKSKNTQRITDVIRQFRLSSVTIEKELSEWESNRSEFDRLISFITGLGRNNLRVI